LWLGAALPKSPPGWLSLAFLAVGPGVVAAVLQSYSMPRLGPTTYAIVAKLRTGHGHRGGREKLTPIRALGDGLILAGMLLHGWVRNLPWVRIAEKPRVADRLHAAG
jgi:drug/metabolite transporter (DMT)-like permease